MVADVPNSPFVDLGRAAPLTPMHLVLVLRCSHESELDGFLEAQSDPTSPIARRVLTAAEFQRYFSPSQESYTRTATLLAGNGLRITRTYANRTVLDVTGSVANVERLFETSIHTVRSHDVVGFANVEPAIAPAELARLVDGVIGFDNLPPLRVRETQSFIHRAKRATGPLQGPDSGYGPRALTAAYDFPVEHSGSSPNGRYDGAGQAVGLAADSDFKNGDLAKFLKYFNVSRKASVTRVAVDGGAGVTYDLRLTSLQVETVAGVSPGADIYLYLMPQIDEPTSLDMYAQVNSDDKVGVLDTSFGFCETQTSPSNFPQLSNTLAKEGAALGIVYVAASGDNGAGVCPTTVNKRGVTVQGGTTTPASGPYFTAVGATTLLLDSGGSYALEYGLNYSSSGASVIFPRPAFQSVARVKSVVGGRRFIPDVAFDGDPASGVSLYFSAKDCLESGCTIVPGWYGPAGGTALSASLFSALVAQLEQIKKGRIASMNAALYSTFQKTGFAGSFNDVTFGYNGLYRAASGFDRLTGIGSVNGWEFSKNAVRL